MRKIALAVLLGCGCGQGPSGLGTGLSGASTESFSGGDSSSGGDPAETLTGTTGDGGTTSAGSTSGGSATGMEGSSGGDGATTMTPDLGEPATGGDPFPGCNGKIDLVFVAVDTEALAPSIPEFVAIMEQRFSEHDLHVMVVDADGEWGDSIRCPKNKCPAEGGCPAEGMEDFPCWALHDGEALSKCDNTLGAGVIFPAAEGASNKPCGLSEGERFVSGDDPLFAERFACLIDGGGAVGGEVQTGMALGRAVSPDLQAGCNQGFLREDALLFVVMIEDAAGIQPYNPLVWAELVLEAKDFDHDRVVALGIDHDWKGSEPEPLCESGWQVEQPSPGEKWTQHFDHSVFGSVCAPSFGPFFADAAALAADLCADVPQG